MGRARHQHADRRVARPPAALRPALLRAHASARAHDVCWLPDCFGFSPALPQLLRRAGIDSFFTIKVNWSETNALPVRPLLVGGPRRQPRARAHLQQPGRRLQRPRSGRARIVETWRNFRGKHRHPESLLAFGYGDGGGGPTRGDARARSGSSTTSPRARAALGRGRRAGSRGVRAQRATTPTLPVWVGEIYLELHRGTLTTQGRTKYLHRRAERDARSPPRRWRAWRRCSARALAAVARAALARAAAQRVPRHPARLEHPRGLRARRGRARRTVVARGGRADRRRSLDALAERLVDARRAPALLVVNPDLSPRPLRARARPSHSPAASAVEGGSVLSGADRGARRSASRSSLERRAARPARSPSRTARERARARRDRRRRHARARLRQARRPRGARRPRQPDLAYVDKPRNWDAWDIEEGYLARGRGARARATRSRSSRRGPHRAAIRDRPPLPRQQDRPGRAPVGELGADRLHDRHRLARAPDAAQGALPARRSARDHATFEMRVRRRRAADASQHLLGRRRASRSPATASPTSPSPATAWRC